MDNEFFGLCTYGHSERITCIKEKTIVLIQTLKIGIVSGLIEHHSVRFISIKLGEYKNG
jgi:hypothetical protein